MIDKDTLRAIEIEYIKIHYSNIVDKIRTDTSFCNDYYNNIFNCLDNEAKLEYHKLNKQFLISILLILLSIIVLIGSAIIAPIFIWFKTYNIFSILVLVIFGIIETIIVFIVALNMLANTSVEFNEYDIYWDNINTDFNTQMLSDIWICNCFELLSNNDWIKENIFKQLIDNNLTNLDIANISSWIINQDKLSGIQLNNYLNSEYNINIKIDNNIDILEIIDSKFELEEDKNEMY